MSKERYIAAKQKWAEKQLAQGFKPRAVAATDRLPPGRPRPPPALLRDSPQSVAFPRRWSLLLPLLHLGP